MNRAHVRVWSSVFRTSSTIASFFRMDVATKEKYVPRSDLHSIYYFGKYCEAVKLSTFLHTDLPMAQLQMERGHGFIAWRRSLRSCSINQLFRQGIEFAMRGYFGGDTVVYEVQLHGFIDDCEEAD